MEITQVKETCLYVQDLERTQRFYENVLNLPVIDKRLNRHVFFRAGTSVLLMFDPESTRNETELPPHFAHGPQHLAFEVPFHEYQIWKDKISAGGIEIIHEQSWKGGYLSFYFKDPDGHILEIVQAGMWD